MVKFEPIGSIIQESPTLAAITQVVGEFKEVFLQTLLGTVDTIMVSRISDDAVVGLAGQLLNALTTVFKTIAGGAGILIAQMIVAILSMSIIATGCSYWFGTQAGWGLIGIYCCMIADELVRGILVLKRWKGQKYLRKAEKREARRTSEARQDSALPI